MWFDLLFGIHEADERIDAVNKQTSFSLLIALEKQRMPVLAPAILLPAHEKSTRISRGTPQSLKLAVLYTYIHITRKERSCDTRHSRLPQPDFRVPNFVVSIFISDSFQTL